MVGTAQVRLCPPYGFMHPEIKNRENNPMQSSAASLNGSRDDAGVHIPCVVDAVDAKSEQAGNWLLYSGRSANSPSVSVE